MVVNAFTASDFVVVPMTTDVYSYYGIELLLASIDEVQENSNPDLKLAGLFYNRKDTRTNISKVIEATVGKMGLPIFKSSIRQDKNLREALCYAIDMDAINETVYGVGTTTASSIVSQTAEGIVDLSENWPYPYDPAKAVECRNAAGYGEGEVKLIYLVGGGDAARTAVGEMMANYLAQVGIEMNIVNVDKSAWASMIKDVNGWDVHLRGISAVGTTYLDYFTNLLASTAHFDNDPASAEMLAAINEIAVTMDSEARLPLWQDFQAKYLSDYLYSLPLSQVNDYTLVSDKLVGAEKVSLFRLNLKDAYFVD